LNASQYITDNYCVSFIDLLGQRDSFRAQGWLPVIKTVADRTNFDGILKKSIGAILGLQRDADDLVGAMLTKPDSPFRLALDEVQRAIWDQVSQKQIQTQYWSDGLIRFALA
jgi:hypothetical protein